MAEQTTKIKFAKDADVGEKIVINVGNGPEEYKVEKGVVTVPARLEASVLGSFPGSTVEGGNTADDSK